MAHSTATRTGRKRTARPAPPKGSPIFPHASGHWAKKVKGQLYYFGPWGKREKGELICMPHCGEHASALARYENEIEDIRRGRKHRRSYDPDGFRLDELCNRWISMKKRKMETGEISARTFKECNEASELLIATFGKRRRVDDCQPADFEELWGVLADKGWGVDRRDKFVGIIRGIFRYAEENDFVERAVRFGSEFKRTPAKKKRQLKAEAPKKLFEPSEIRLMLRALEGEEVVVTRRRKQHKLKIAANPTLRAILLLGINAALGNSDIAALQIGHLDLERGWLKYPRPKTGCPRKAALWPETVAAVMAAIAFRRDPKDPKHDQLVFLNRAGR